MRRLSTAVVQRFCKPKVGGSIPSAGTMGRPPFHAIPNAKWGPASLPVPTSVRSAIRVSLKRCDHRLANLSVSLQGEGDGQDVRRFLAKGRLPVLVACSATRRSLSRALGNGLQRPSVEWRVLPEKNIVVRRTSNE